MANLSAPHLHRDNLNVLVKFEHAALASLSRRRRRCGEMRHPHLSPKVRALVHSSRRLWHSGRLSPAGWPSDDGQAPVGNHDLTGDPARLG
jgi:hypothetical protein